MFLKKSKSVFKLQKRFRHKPGDNLPPLEAEKRYNITLNDKGFTLSLKSEDFKKNVLWDTVKTIFAQISSEDVFGYKDYSFSFHIKENQKVSLLEIMDDPRLEGIENLIKKIKELDGFVLKEWEKYEKYNGKPTQMAFTIYEKKVDIFDNKIFKV